MTVSVRGYGAVGNGTTNDTAAIQAAINSRAACGGGVVEVEAGNYFCPGLYLPAQVSLRGEGQNVSLLQSLSYDSTVLTLGAGSFHGVRDLSIFGRNDPSTGTNAVVMPAGVVSAVFRDCMIWLGYSAVYTQSIDCLFDNCYIGNSYHGAAITSNGANWYQRCKIDSLGACVVGGKPTPYYAFLQGASATGLIAENHFNMCDLSGDYDLSVLIDDSFNQAVTDFSGCVMSAPISVAGAKATFIRGCELGGDVSNSHGAPMTMVANIAVGAGITAQYVTAQSGNVGITFI